MQFSGAKLVTASVWRMKVSTILSDKRDGHMWAILAVSLSTKIQQSEGTLKLIYFNKKGFEFQHLPININLLRNVTK